MYKGKLITILEFIRITSLTQRYGTRSGAQDSVKSTCSAKTKQNMEDGKKSAPACQGKRFDPLGQEFKRGMGLRKEGKLRRVYSQQK